MILRQRLLAAIIVINFVLGGEAIARSTPRPQGHAPCESASQRGVVSMPTGGIGGLNTCSYAIAGPSFMFEASSDANSARILVQAPISGGSCAGTPNIAIEYTDARGNQFRASSSDGTTTDLTGTCTVSVNRATQHSFSATITATVVDALVVSCKKMYASGHILPDARQNCDPIISKQGSQSIQVIASIQSD